MQDVPPLVLLKDGVLPTFLISSSFALTKSSTMFPLSSFLEAPHNVVLALKSPAIRVWSVGLEMRLIVFSSACSSREKRREEYLGLK